MYSNNHSGRVKGLLVLIRLKHRDYVFLILRDEPDDVFGDWSWEKWQRMKAAINIQTLRSVLIAKNTVYREEAPSDIDWLGLGR